MILQVRVVEGTGKVFFLRSNGIDASTAFRGEDRYASDEGEKVG